MSYFADIIANTRLQLEGCLAIGGIVMVPLVLVSLLMWLMIIDRALFFRRLNRRNMGFTVALDHLRSGNLPDPKKHSGAVGLLVARFLARRSGHRPLDRLILDETVMGINNFLDGRLALIGVLAAVAPLLGLLGTVTGMIATFDVMAVFGTGNAKAMAGGISEALITTQTGLLVAIPGLYMKSLLDGRARHLQQQIAAAGLFLRRQL